jgi:hypothetical protein
MALAYKTLGQANPAATTLTTLYTAATAAGVSSIVICNQGVAGTFRISIAVAAAADATKQYLYYDIPIDANDTFVATIGATLAATDLIRCYASHANMSFNVFGLET